MKLPVKLYKYEGFSTQSLLNLKSQIIFFGSPLNFNDPYDSALTVTISEPSGDSVERLRARYLAKAPSKEARVELENASPQYLKESFIAAGENGIKEGTKVFLRTKGVSCFSEKYDDLLMWGHYGGRYKGFCLEFSTQHEVFHKARKVDYVPKPPAIDLERILTDRRDDLIQALFCTKSEAWRYEKEWRVIHHEVGTQYGYPPECLTGVYFGPDIDSQSLEIICLILKGQNSNVKLWAGKRSNTEFKVEFEPFEYFSHIESKMQGKIEMEAPNA